MQAAGPLPAEDLILTIAQLLLALISIFVAAKVAGMFAERLGQPAVLGELIGGVLIGVSGLHLVDPHDVTIHLFSELGVILLLFLIGLETDLKKLISVGGPAVAVAIAGVTLPFVAGAGFGYVLGLPMMVAVCLGAALTATSVGITARVLSDLGHLHDAESQIILGAAVVDDIIGLILLTLVGTLAEGGALTLFGVVKIVVIAFGFVLLAIVIGSWLAPSLIRLVDRIRMTRGLFFSSMVFAFLLAFIAQRVGSAIVIGSFAAGLVLARTGRGKEIERQIHDIGQFFVPIFFVVVGAAVDLSSVNPLTAAGRRYLLIGLGLTVLAVLGKVAAGFVVRRNDVRRTVIGVGMIPRGEVGLIFAQIGLATKLLDAGLFSAVALMVMLTTFTAPLLLRRMLVAREPHERDDCNLVVDTPVDRSTMAR